MGLNLGLPKWVALDKRFPNRWVSGPGSVLWAPHNGFFFWGNLKNTVFSEKFNSSNHHLTRRIAGAVSSVRPDILRPPTQEQRSAEVILIYEYFEMYATFLDVPVTATKEQESYSLISCTVNI